MLYQSQQLLASYSSHFHIVYSSLIPQSSHHQSMMLKHRWKSDPAARIMGAYFLSSVFRIVRANQSSSIMVKINLQTKRLKTKRAVNRPTKVFLYHHYECGSAQARNKP